MNDSAYGTYDREEKCIELFKRVNCGPDLDKMQLHILECLDALCHAKILLKKRDSDTPDWNEKLESAKDNVFASAISTILDDRSPYKKQREIIQVFS
jgi:hypothetical protein